MLTVNVAAVSYGLGAALFAVLTALLLTAWRGRLQGALLVVASAVSALWCAAQVGHALYAVPPFWLLQLAEIGRDGAWLMFLAGLLGTGNLAQLRRPGIGRVLALTVLALAGGLAALIVLARLGWSFGLEAQQYTRVNLLGFLALAVIGLVVVHQLFRDTRPEHRWATKFLFFGVGGLFAYDLYLYSVALLFNQLDVPSWVARGVVNAIVVPFVAVAARRNPSWSVEVFVSRHVVFHSTALLGVGIYLMLMAGAGYYIRLYGGSWGGVAQMAFLFLALLLLGTLLLSGQLRARLRVFLNKHFFKNKYDYREEWLKFTRTLSADELDSEPKENIIRAIADIVQSARGVMWLRQSSEHFQPVAALNTPLPGAATVRPESPLVRFLEQSGWVVYLDEFESAPERYAGLALPEWMAELRDPWMIVPLLHGAELVAFIVISRSNSPRELNWEDSDLLKTCGRQAASLLALLKVSEALADARQFEAFNRLSAYVVHDLKNLVAQLALVVSNAERHMHAPGFIEDAIKTVENATQKMNRLLAQLRKDRMSQGKARSVNLPDIMSEVVRARAQSRPVPVLEAAPSELRVTVEPDRLASVIEHLVQNAQEATREDGSVRVVVSRWRDWAQVEVIDTGCGMDAGFISERLFRPFDTTKGNAGMGVGVYESREFVVAAGGNLDVESSPGAGTVFRIRLPLDGEGTAPAEAPTLEAVR